MKEKIGIIVQARTASTRLPNKVLEKICGKTVLLLLIERLKEVKNKDEIVIATTNEKRDQKILEVAKECGVKSFAGSENNVLDRYYQAAKKFKIDIIVRITSDCPLIDPLMVDRVIECFLNVKKANYASNVIKRTFPDGLDTEVFSFETLERLWNTVKESNGKEHVTSYILNHPEKFSVINVSYKKDLSRLRWTLDTKKDLKFIRIVYKQLYNKKKTFHMNDVLELLKRRPQLTKINIQGAQK